MQLWYLTVEFKIWNVIFIHSNQISRWNLNLLLNYIWTIYQIASGKKYRGIPSVKF